MAGPPPTHSAPTLLQRAAYLIDLGRATEALPLIHEALTADPGSSAAYCYLCLAHLAENRLSDALDAARRAIALAPDDEWGYRLSAIVFQRLGCVQDAVSSAKEAVRCSPEGREALYTMSESYLIAGQTDRAMEVAEHLSWIEPDWYQAHYLLARVTREAGRLPAAEEHIRQALAMEPERAPLLRELGAVLQAQGRSLEALEAYDLAARQDPCRATSGICSLPYVQPFSFASLFRVLGMRACASMVAAAVIVLLLRPKDPDTWTGWITLGACGVSWYSPVRRWWVGRQHVRPEVLHFFETQRRKEWLATLAVVAVLSGIFGTVVWAGDMLQRRGTPEAPGALEIAGCLALAAAATSAVLAGMRKSLRERARAEERA